MGLSAPIVLNVLIEYLPIKYRNFTMNSIYCGFSAGQILLLLCQMVVMPNFESNQVITILLCMWFWIFLGTIGFLLFFEDSPRNLILAGEHNRGIRIYRAMFKRNNIYISSEQKKSMIDYIEKSNNRIVESNLSSIFNNEFFAISLILAFQWFIISMVRYGPLLIYTETIKELEMASLRNIIANHIYIALGMFFINLLFAWIAEFKIVGLKRILFISYGLALIFCSLNVGIPDYLNIWMSIASVLLNPVNSAISTYTHIIFPTKIRDTSMGLFLFIKYMGAIVAQFVFLGFFAIEVIVPYCILLGLTLVSFVMVFILPLEPSQEHLDEDLKSMAMHNK